MATALKTGGLDGVVVAETRLSHVDGERGQLVVAGDNVEDVAGRQRYSQMAARLWHLGSGDDVTHVEALLGRARVDAFAKRNEAAWKMADGMDALRASLAAMTLSPGLSAVEEAAQLAGAMAVNAAGWARV